MESAVVLASGGMDSCVTVALAHLSHELALLHVSYGQRTEQRELRAFGDIADFYKVPTDRRLATSIEYLRQIGGSALTDPSIEVPVEGVELGIPVTYVPLRNTHLLAIAASWAEVIGARRIFIGAVEADSSGYPDCRKVYYESFNALLRVAARPETKIEVVAPLIELSKAEIIRKGVALGAPLDRTWSCYVRSDLACGRCDSCRLRRKGFAEAGHADPIEYAAS